MDFSLAQSLLAGWVAGAVAGLASTGGLMILIARRPGLAARLPLARNLAVIGVVAANALTFGLTLVGLILGALFHRAGGEEAAVRFGLVAGGGFFVVAALYSFVRGRLLTREAPGVILVLVVSALSFGIVLPVLGAVTVER